MSSCVVNGGVLGSILAGVDVGGFVAGDAGAGGVTGISVCSAGFAGSLGGAGTAVEAFSTIFLIEAAANCLTSSLDTPMPQLG
jgi:hypothetical protein